MSSAVFGVANTKNVGPVTREIFYFIFYTKLHALYFKILYKNPLNVIFFVSCTFSLAKQGA